MPTTLDRIGYGFDRDSRRTWRRRVLTTNEDNAYGYDGLSQVVQDARGNLNLNQTAISAVPVSQEDWDYDPTGNWRGYQTQAEGSVTLDQHRVHDKGNRLTQIEDDPYPILLDRAGRMRQLPPDATGDWDESLELKWDAWGRVTQVKRVISSEVIGTYAYDGLTRRTTREVDSAVQHSYYSDAWRPLEERKDAETDASAQYLWGARHRDDLVRRDRDSDGDGDLDETRYVLMDYYSPASITDGTGAVKERYAFSAFGIRRIMAPDWSPRSVSEFAFQGQFLDIESGLLNYGYRYYSPFLGRWTEKDPTGEAAGSNLFFMVGNRSINLTDFLGLETCIGHRGEKAHPRFVDIFPCLTGNKADDFEAQKKAVAGVRNLPGNPNGVGYKAAQQAAKDYLDALKSQDATLNSIAGLTLGKLWVEIEYDICQGSWWSACAIPTWQTATPTYKHSCGVGASATIDQIAKCIADAYDAALK